MKPVTRNSAREATLEDVAGLCGVSYQTVSRVVNQSPLVAEKTRVRVAAAIQELGYRPNLVARRLATRRSLLVGMIGSNLTHHGPAQTMVSIEEAVKRRGYHLMFAGLPRPSRAQLAAAVGALREQRIDGLVLGVPVAGKTGYVRELCRETPFVTLDAAITTDAPTVMVDQRHGARISVQHLLGLGHRRVACIAGPQDWSAGVDRRAAWQQTLRQAGLEPGPCVPGDWSAQSGYAAARRLLELVPRRFTAIVAGNDHMALGALRALRVHGVRVPADVSVVGFDDLPEARFFDPPLTTVRNDFAAQGQRSVELLLRLIDREVVDPPLQLLRPELIVRESTGPASTA